MLRTIETGTDELLAHVDEGVAVITFNRPETRNALSGAMLTGLGRILPDLADDPEVRVLMVTGAGGAFCSGGDIRAYSEGRAREDRPVGFDGQVSRLQRLHRQVPLALHRMPKPVVAALSGAAAGAGLSIALAADVRLAAERAILVPAFAALGVSGDLGGSWFLTNLVGMSRAKELYWGSPRLSSSEALKLGLVNRVLADDDFEQAALSYCRDLASRAPIALRLMKENIDRATTCDLDVALDAEATNMVRTLSSADLREGAAAFLEKRPPAFRGE